MKRRDVLKTALLGGGAALAGEAHAARPQPAVSAAASAASSAETARPGVWKPLLFDEHQNQTVITLTDLIIPATDTPGAKEARVNEYIDLILHHGDAAARGRFLEGLGWLDGYAIREHNSPFAKCSAGQQVALLQSLDRAKGRELQPGARFFRQIKQLTIEGYYTSKTGIAEINKDGQIPDTFACRHEEHG